ncbi:MAG TPA: hypothetical protein VGP07_13165 [Polyangia bacterium]
MIVAALAPFSTSFHEASVQHVRCAEHGELTHVAVASDGAAGLADLADRTGATRLVLKGPDASKPAEHEHCAVAFVVQGNAQAPTARAVVRLIPPTVVVVPAARLASCLGRAALLASAPKTSPPTV